MSPLVVAGIPYLRSGREELCEQVAHALGRGDETEALLLLLADQDDWWDEPPPPRERLRAATTAPTLREAMDLLGFGRVGDYFAYRWSDPTFLSGLALLDRHAGGASSAFELGCGIGHLLRELRRRGVRVAGADVVFAKLWLAKRFVVPDAELVCLDAADPLPLGDDSVDLAFCHDALHYFPDPAHTAAELRRIARQTVVFGHVHNAAAENPSAGTPLEVATVAGLLPDPQCYDDAELGRALAGGTQAQPRPPAALEQAEAVAVASGGRPSGAYGSPPAGTALRVNPLFGADGTVRWPSPRYEAEYAALSPHLTEPWELPGGPLQAGRDAHVDALARRRILLDLPERW